MKRRLLPDIVKALYLQKKLLRLRTFGEGLYYVRWLAGVALKDVSKEVKIPLPALYQYEGWRAYAKFGTFL